MKQTIEQLHIAAQYLAAANISFLEPKTDDSHTNLGWDKTNSRLTSHQFGPKNNQLGLKFDSGKLEWLENGALKDDIDLEKYTHYDLINWIKSHVEKSNLRTPFEYSFHYELPYQKIKDNDTFKLNSADIDTVITRLDTGQTTFENVLANHTLKSPIRIWPHHFDLGIYVQLDGNGKLFMGGGLAIPDTLVDDMYFYASGWKNGQAVVTGNFSELENGEWRSDWNGATLPSDGATVSKVELFYKRAIDQFRSDA